jgi:hypothetical protein
VTIGCDGGALHKLPASGEELPATSAAGRGELACAQERKEHTSQTAVTTHMSLCPLHLLAKRE